MRHALKPIVVIGAGRSGTNMLRDILTRFDGLVTWPCDEINYIWRHGNRDWPTDEFPPDQATPSVRAYIRSAFDRLASRHGGACVVEKTCANSLRVGFVHRVMPEATFIQIVRDGRDVAASAAQRWAAPLDLPYLLRKARYVPKGDLAYYATRYLRNRIHAVRSPLKQLAVWGPRFEGMESVFRENPLPVACAIQWQHCVQNSRRDLEACQPESVYTLRYEDLIAHPDAELEKLLAFLGREESCETRQRALQLIRPGSVGLWEKTLSSEDVTGIEQQVGTTLSACGYE